MSRFKVYTRCNDPRGKHCTVVDTENNIVVSRAWKECDAEEVKDLINGGEIAPNYESRYINRDVDEILNAN